MDGWGKLSEENCAMGSRKKLMLASLIAVIMALSSAISADGVTIKGKDITTGNVLRVANTSAPAGTVNHQIPLSLFRGTDVTDSPATLDVTFPFNTAVLTAKSPFAVPDTAGPAGSSLLSFWYTKSLSSSAATPGQIDLVISGGTFEITTFDNQRFGGTPAAQQNPFPLGSLLFDVAGAPGASTVVGVADLSMANSDAARLTDAVGQPGSFNVGTACTLPSAPTGVSATDGTYADKVRITWNAVAGSGITYRVYRDGTAIGSWQAATSYDDYGAAPPDIRSTGGCQPTQIVDYHYHQYTVKAKNDCGESGYSTSNSGHRGAAKSFHVDATIYEKALPVLPVSPYAELAVRLVTEEPIEPSTLWAVAEGDGWFEEGGTWRATNPDDNRDGWVILTPTESWPPGQPVTVTVGATTESGQDIGPISQTFEIGIEQPEDLVQAEPNMVAEADAESVPPLAADAASPVYCIGPEGVFHEAITVWIPVPAEADPNALEIYYFSESEEHRGWYRGENVVGWMVPDSRRIAEQDGDMFIEIQVNHSGLVQLADRQTASATADVGMFVGLAAIIGWQRFRRRRSASMADSRSALSPESG
jgi:hypothetical protein